LYEKAQRSCLKEARPNFPSSEETGMFATRYVGVHRAPEREDITSSVVKSVWTRRLLVPLAATTVAIFGIGSTAFASPVHVASGDTFSGLVASHCNTNNWQNVALPGRNKNLIYAGETIDITCSGTVSAKAAVAVAASTPAPRAVTSVWANPLPGRKSYCNYGENRGSYSHRGEDIAAPSGTPIHAVHAGSVQVQYDAGGGGNMTIIQHDGMAEVYMHQSRYQVRSGLVRAGDVIGYVGATGDATGPHLHLEIQPYGPWKGVTSPDRWLAARGVYIGC
jgi:murein DD-endopeptidase MepM/ murein hydrolase activator NlpD